VSREFLPGFGFQGESHLHVVELHVEREALVGRDFVDHLVVGLHARLKGELPFESVGLFGTLDLQDDSVQEHRGIGVTLDLLDRLYVVERRDTACVKRRETHGWNSSGLGMVSAIQVRTWV